MPHPELPHSNVAKFSGYHPDKYAIDDVSPTLKTDESLTPSRPPALTQRTVAKFLQPLTRELVELPPRPTIDELPDPVLEKMVKKDKAFWVDKPGANAYTLHDAYYNYGMTTAKSLPPHQDVFPRSYQYDLDCVKYRRRNACNQLNKENKVQQCHSCDQNIALKRLTSPTSETTQKRWKYYPDVTANLSPEQIKNMMNEFGRPFKNEACNWYNKYYPSTKYNYILKKFSK